MALANNGRLRVSKSGPGLAVIVSSLGGLIVADNHIASSSRLVPSQPIGVDSIYLSVFFGVFIS